MKISQYNSDFNPVTLTIETEEELEYLKRLIAYSHWLAELITEKSSIEDGERFSSLDNKYGMVLYYLLNEVK